MTNDAAEEVARFWIEEKGAKAWFIADPAVDAEIAARFGALVAAAGRGELRRPGADWSESRTGALALLILLDQFPRNLHRGAAAAFAQDARALALAQRCVERGDDLRTPEPGRLLYYLPYQHSERLEVQDQGVALCRDRLFGMADVLPHALKHRELIQRFGRFPHRNAALGRESAAEEVAHLESGGYAPGAAPKRKG